MEIDFQERKVLRWWESGHPTYEIVEEDDMGNLACSMTHTTKLINNSYYDAILHKHMEKWEFFYILIRNYLSRESIERSCNHLHCEKPHSWCDRGDSSRSRFSEATTGFFPSSGSLGLRWRSGLARNLHTGLCIENHSENVIHKLRNVLALTPPTNSG